MSKSADPHYNKRRNLKTRYGMPLAEYMQRLNQQGGVCAICKRPPSASRHGTLAVDHDHNNGIVRGLLCHRCNTGLGHFDDNPPTVLKAHLYLLSPDNNTRQSDSMATANTIAIRNIGRIEATRFVKLPNKPIPQRVTRMFPKHKIGRVIHDGAFGPRRGSFKKD